MNIVIDTSAIIAVIADEPENERLVELTKGATIKEILQAVRESRERYA